MTSDRPCTSLPSGAAPRRPADVRPRNPWSWSNETCCGPVPRGLNDVLRTLNCLPVERLISVAFGVAALLLAAGPASAAVVFAPQYAGSFAAGQGADATFLQIDSRWHASSVLWNENLRQFGSGAPIGSFAWGTGLWGRADWATTQQAAAGGGGGEGSSGSGPTITNRWSGTVGSINFANGLYNSAYSATWGPAALLPFFDPAMPVSAQQNWTSAFSGYIRITDAGNYNFSVLNDDGFFLRLIGAGGSTQDIGRDFLNPRERNGFAEDLGLSEGLYGFELGMWNREEAGVVDLRWSRNGGDDWTLVPVTNLVRANAIPEPGALALGALALGGVAVWSRRRRSRARAA